MANQNLTPLQVLNKLSSFIRVCIEQIWYHLAIYPKESFSEYTFYELQVFSSRHPSVIAYLDEFETNLRSLLKEGTLLRLYLEVYDGSKRRYSIGFSFKNSLLFEQLKNDTQFMEQDRNNELFNSFTFINELKSLLFSIITEVVDIEKVPPKQVGDFKLLIATLDDVRMATDSNWILEKNINNEPVNADLKFQNVELHPFKEISLGYLNIKGYITLY